MSWRVASANKNTGYSLRGLRFDSQLPSGRPQASITPVPGEPTSSAGF